MLIFNKKSYLEKHYEKNNPLRDHLTINQKLLFKPLTFLITIITYYILKVADTHDLFNRSNTIRNSDFEILNQLDLAKILPIIIMISMFIVALGIVATIIALIKPKFLEKPFFKASFQNKNRLFNVLDMTAIIPICAVVAMFINIFIFSSNVVVGSSMEPTFVNGDKVIILNYKKPKRFDVIVIDVDPDVYDAPAHQLYIKRVIGLPGDAIEYKPDDIGFVYINGERYPEDYLPEPDQPDDFESHCLAGNYPKFCFYVTDGVAHVPEGYYLAIGDNRKDEYGNNVSSDSRMIGFIRAQDIVGVVTKKRG